MSEKNDAMLLWLGGYWRCYGRTINIGWFRICFSQRNNKVWRRARETKQGQDQRKTPGKKKEVIAGLLLRSRRVAANELWARGLGLVSIVDLQLLLWLFSCCEANERRKRPGGGKQGGLVALGKHARQANYQNSLECPTHCTNTLYLCTVNDGDSTVCLLSQRPITTNLTEA